MSHAFHSPLMEPIVPEFRHELSGLAPQPAEFPLFSTVLGREVEGREMNADYWARRYARRCSSSTPFGPPRQVGADYVAEAGPRCRLITLARQAGLPSRTPSLGLCSGPDSEGKELLGVAVTLLRDGYSPDLSPLYGRPAGPLQRIPGYVFDDSSRFWFDGPVSQVTTTARAVAQADTEVVRDHAEGEVLAVIADVGGHSVGELARYKRLTDDLGYDSLLQLRLLDRLRKEYPQLGHIAVAEVLPRIQNVGDLVDFVMHRFDRSRPPPRRCNRRI